MAGFLPGPCISGVTEKEVGWRKDNSSQWEQGMTPPLIWASVNSCLPFIGLSWQTQGLSAVTFHAVSPGTGDPLRLCMPYVPQPCVPCSTLMYCALSALLPYLLWDSLLLFPKVSLRPRDLSLHPARLPSSLALGVQTDPLSIAS